MSDIAQPDEVALLELQLIARADELSAAEAAQTEEFLLAVIAKVNSYQAQKQAEHRHGAAVRLAQANYEIALARLKRGA